MTPTPTPLVAARGITVELGGRPVLHDVSAHIGAGEVVAMVGPNGAGKSSLLGALSGDLEPSAGVVEVEGRPIGSWDPRDLARVRAVMPQRVAVAFPFLVGEVVRMGRAPWIGTPKEDDDDRAVADALGIADLHDLARRPVTALSGGEQARAALARVLAQETPLLLLDEPTASLDLHHQEAVMVALRALARAGHGVGVVVHDLSLAAAFADRILLVADGHLRADGPPATVLDTDLLGEVFHHPVRVLPDPDTGDLLVAPIRTRP
jgi:iron complex transport system ATP-binding protein